MNDDLVVWIRWFLSNVTDPGDFRWEKMREAANEIESLRQQLAEKDHTILDHVEIQNALRQQLAEVKGEKARGAAEALLAVQHDYQEIKSLRQQLASSDAEIAELRQQVTLLRDAIEAIWTNPNWKPDTMPRALIDQLQTAYKGELK